MRISDWSSDVCSSELVDDELTALAAQPQRAARHPSDDRAGDRRGDLDLLAEEFDALRFDAFALTPVDRPQGSRYRAFERLFERSGAGAYRHGDQRYLRRRWCPVGRARRRLDIGRSGEHTSELQSIMTISYCVF